MAIAKDYSYLIGTTQGRLEVIELGRKGKRKAVVGGKGQVETLTNFQCSRENDMDLDTLNKKLDLVIMQNCVIELQNEFIVHLHSGSRSKCEHIAEVMKKCIDKNEKMLDELYGEQQ